MCQYGFRKGRTKIRRNPNIPIYATRPVRGGIRYSCWCLRAEIGYELDQYFDVIVDEQTNVQSPSTLSDNFAIGGPYIGLSLTY